MRERAVHALGELSAEERRLVLAALSEADRRALEGHWPSWAHAGQLPPEGSWRVWLLMAGRGFGKTRAGAEWVLDMARRPLAGLGTEGPIRIALVGATAEEARAVMVEGPSGLLALAREEERETMLWEPSRRRLRLAGGAEAFLYSGGNPEALRGPEHHIAWCDELAKWRKAAEAWHNLQLGLRLGPQPRALVTTTPRAVAALKAIVGATGTVSSGGGTRANPHLPEAFVAAMEEEHGGTRFGRQELGGELIEEIAGALWPRSLIEASRAEIGRDALRRIVVGVDPPASAEGDACGIVVCGMGHDGIGYVLADLSAGGLSPEGWARKVAAAAEAWGAHRVVAEKNMGGAMVETVLRSAGIGLPLTLVHAADGKAARAEPVAVLFESKRAKLAGRFPELEDELAGLTLGGGYQGPGRSPDRADACVWAMTELFRTVSQPRVRTL